MTKVTGSEKFEGIKAEINRIIESMEKDAEKFYNKDNATAGVRLRKGYKALGVLIKEKSNETSPKNKKG